MYWFLTHTVHDLIFICPFLGARALARARAHTSFKSFGICCLWSWLGPPQASLRYIMYFRFSGWPVFSTMGRIAVWILQ